MRHGNNLSVSKAGFRDGRHKPLCRPRGTLNLNQPLPSAEALGFLMSSRTAGLRFDEAERCCRDPLLEDCEMFRVRHCRVTSLASAMLRMISDVLRRPHSTRPSLPSQRVTRHRRQQAPG